MSGETVLLLWRHKIYFALITANVMAQWRLAGDINDGSSLVWRRWWRQWQAQNYRHNTHKLRIQKSVANIYYEQSLRVHIAYTMSAYIEHWIPFEMERPWWCSLLTGAPSIKSNSAKVDSSVWAFCCCCCCCLISAVFAFILKKLRALLSVNFEFNTNMLSRIDLLFIVSHA